VIRAVVLVLARLQLDQRGLRPNEGNLGEIVRKAVRPVEREGMDRRLVADDELVITVRERLHHLAALRQGDVEAWADSPDQGRRRTRVAESAAGEDECRGCCRDRSKSYTGHCSPL